MYNRQKLNAKTFNQLHENSLRFLKKEFEKLRGKPKIVITHHLPSNSCNAMEFIGSKINSAFCTDLTSFVQTSEADYWIYAHSHRNLPEFSISKTKMITNQLGYIQLNEDQGFRRDACITF